MALGALSALIVFEYFKGTYEHRASEFDLKALDRMEAASVLYDRAGREIGKIFILNRQPISGNQIPDLLVKAVIAAEDKKFYHHDGVDYKGVIRAAIANYKYGRIAQGASTVTQQLARNSFNLKERSYERKLLEMFLARRIEQNFPKAKIMEMYLNRVYFGSGLHGAEAAARGYFGKPARELDAGQCAMLAGLLKSPQALSPWNNLKGATEARNFVLNSMREMGSITREQYDQQVATPLYVLRRTNPFKTSYAIDLIRQQAISALGFQRAMSGGYRIDTTLDFDMQQAAERSTRETLSQIEAHPGYKHETFATYREQVKEIESAFNQGHMDKKFPEPRYLQAALLALENKSGGILAIVGGREFKHSEYNRALQSKRPAGTAFTPFVYAAAFEKGIFPGDIVQDACLDNRFVMIGGSTGILGEWGVEKEVNDYEGPMTLHDSLIKGKNAAAIRVGLRTGLDATKATVLKAGIKSPLRDFSNTYLGSSEMTLEELTAAFTAFANGGERPDRPHIITKISDVGGNVIYQAEIKSERAFSANTAFQVHSALRDYLQNGDGSIARQGFGLGNFPAAGKSGTAYNFTDTYFFGYTSSVTCGVWVGFDRPVKIYRGAFGKDLALPIWTRVMNVASVSFPAEEIIKPATLKEVEICRVSGLLATPNCSAAGAQMVCKEYATAAQMPQIRCDIHGGGIRNYVKLYEQEEWPRAASAVDLATIRPVAVSAPTLLGFNDVYNSVRPAAQKFDEDSIPVAKAIAVTPDEGSKPPEQESLVPAAQPLPTPDDLEVRKAQPVRPLDSPLDIPAITIQQPKPIDF